MRWIRMIVISTLLSVLPGAAALGKGAPKPMSFADVMAVIGKRPLAMEDDHAAHLIPKRRFLLSATVLRARHPGPPGQNPQRETFFTALVYHWHGRMIIFEKFGARKLAYYARDRKHHVLLVGVDLVKPKRAIVSHRGALMLLLLSNRGAFGVDGGYSHRPKLHVNNWAFLSLRSLNQAESVCFSRAGAVLSARYVGHHHIKQTSLRFSGGPSLYLGGAGRIAYTEKSRSGRFIWSVVMSLKFGKAAPRLPLHLTARGLRKLGFIMQPHGGTALSRFVLHKLKAGPGNAGKPIWRGAKARQLAAKFIRWATKPHRPTRHPQRKWKHPLRPRSRPNWRGQKPLHGN